MPASTVDIVPRRRPLLSQKPAAAPHRGKRPPRFHFACRAHDGTVSRPLAADPISARHAASRSAHAERTFAVCLRMFVPWCSSLVHSCFCVFHPPSCLLPFVALAPRGCPNCHSLHARLNCMYVSNSCPFASLQWHWQLVTPTARATPARARANAATVPIRGSTVIHWGASHPFACVLH